MQSYSIRNTDSLEDRKKITKLKDLLKRKRLKHWQSSQRSGVSYYKRDEESQPSIELVFHQTTTKPDQFFMLQKDLQMV